jgi:hypothetical protein
MTAHETRHRDAKQFLNGGRFLDANPNISLCDAVRIVVDKCPNLNFEYLAILLGDWGQQFRIEGQAEIESMLQIALERRGA